MRFTIAQLRERELDRLVKYKTNTPTESDYSEARRIMNSFYRLCGLSERNLYLSNSERMCNSRYAREMEDKEDRWYKRLGKRFKEIYNLDLYYVGYCPSIGIRHLPGGACEEKINRYFYNN